MGDVIRMLARAVRIVSFAVAMIAPARATAQSTPSHAPRTPAHAGRAVAAQSTHRARTHAAPLPCLRPPVEIHRTNDRGSWVGSLTTCDGRPTVRALAAVSMLAAPSRITDTLPDLAPTMDAIRRAAPVAHWHLAEDVPMPSARERVCPLGTEPLPEAASRAFASAPSRSHDASRAHARRAHGPRCRPIEIPSDPHTRDPMLVLDNDVRVVHPRLIQMLQTVAEHFRGHRIDIVSGYRPSSNPDAGSRHAHARALDFRIVNVSRESLRDFARTLPNAGVGYYPNGIFTHMDVRDPDEGPAHWTDYSGHGEAPRYGHWPPRDTDLIRESNFLVQQAEHTLSALRNDENETSEPETSSP